MTFGGGTAASYLHHVETQMAVPIIKSPVSLYCCRGQPRAQLEGERSEDKPADKPTLLCLTRPSVLGSQELLTA